MTRFPVLMKAGILVSALHKTNHSMSANRSHVVLAAVLLAVLLHAGCGRKAKLYLPDTPRPAQTGSEAATQDEGPSLPPPPAAP